MAQVSTQEEKIRAASLVDLELDEAKLSSATASEQGEVYLLQWLSKAERALATLDDETIGSIQSKFEATLVRLIIHSSTTTTSSSAVTGSASASSSSASSANAGGTNGASSGTGGAVGTAYPRIGRPARHIIARCLVRLFEHGDSRSLYDVLQSLMRAASADEAKVEIRAASLYVAGQVFGSSGHLVMSVFVDLAALCQRTFKQGSNVPLVRYHALLCLSKVIQKSGKALQDAAAKDLVKALKQGLGDRAGAVARGSAEVRDLRE